MDYRQYTTCVKPENHLDMAWYVHVTIEAAVAGALGALMVAAAVEPWCLLVVAEIMLIQATLAYCHWWLEDRLICLGGDRTMVGMLISVEPPWKKTGFGAVDTDYSLNLLLASNPPGADYDTVAASAPYGELVRKNPSVSLPFTPNYEEGGQKGLDGKPLRSATMHAEFEGGGPKDMLLGAQVALGLAVFALIACMAAGYWGAAIAVFLALLALLAMWLGLRGGLNDTGKPGDVNPALGDLSASSDDAGGIGADILFIAGTWVYDAGHNHDSAGDGGPQGWNELHPIKFCQRLGKWTGDWPPNLVQLTKDANDQYTKANDPNTGAAQGRLENQWEVHPLIDGCRGKDDPPPIR